MALKLSMTDTAIVLWALRKRLEDEIEEGVLDDEDIEDVQRLIDTFGRSFKAKLRIEK